MNHWERIKQLNVLEPIKATSSTVVTGTNRVINCLFSHVVVSTSRAPYMNIKPRQSPSSSGRWAEICDPCRSKSYPCCCCEIPYGHGERQSDNHEAAADLLQFSPWLTAIWETFLLTFTVHTLHRRNHAYKHNITHALMFLFNFFCCTHLQQMDEFSIAFDTTVMTFKQAIMLAPKSLKADRQNKGSQFSTSEKQ